MSEGSSPDQRRFPRLRKSCRVRYQRIRSDSVPDERMEALTVNISGGGICFEAEEEFAPGTLLAIELTLPDFDAPVVAMGRSVWSRASEAGKFELGMEFWWIGWGDEGAQQAVSAYIKRSLEAPPG